MAKDKPKPIPAGSNELKRAVRRGKQKTNLERDLENKNDDKEDEDKSK